MASRKKPADAGSGTVVTGSADTPYLVLARKYRPLNFDDLIGQQAMVQTLQNAFAANRLHHAYILTGVRGVGKTTTARILARAFNYADKDGPAPNIDLLEEGEHCRAIIEGRHVDVVEMDAASNTGINDIREIIDSIRYGPVSAPYKVFIIDEVHMLSTAAFNGLLKTLEEPPPYVKFIFATTEIRKVPVTILSRCQRFDLRRIAPDVLTDYLTGILEKEGVACEPDALAMIVRAGEGSARDCLSLMDQAIAHAGGTVTATTVSAMLGLADRSRMIDLFETLHSGDIAKALIDTRDLYDAGADPQTILADLADLTHLVTRLKVVAAAVDDPALTPDERTRGKELSAKLGMRVLTRTWQILSNGLQEVARASNALQAAEMVLIRLTHAADLPTPDELIESLNQNASSAAAPPATSPRATGNSAPVNAGASGRTAVARQAEPAPVLPPEAAPQAFANPQSFEDLVALAGAERDLAVKHALEANVRPVAFEPGRLEVALTENADTSIIATLSARLKAWTGKPWMVTVTNRQSETPTLRELQKAERDAHHSEAHTDPLVQAVLDTFPGARLVNVVVRDAGRPDDIENAASPEEDEEDL
jgi:DNA polymerase-3 subunit gamma/tau